MFMKKRKTYNCVRHNHVLFVTRSIGPDDLTRARATHMQTVRVPNHNHSALI